MKGIVKKNQVIITSLAILIAVAGYLNYTEKNVIKQTNKAKEVGEQLDDTIPVADNSNGEIGSNSTENSKEKDTENNTGDMVENSTESSEENNTEESSDEDSVPGEAILTNVGTFSANARLQREQLRAKNKETLLNMINSGNLTEEQKDDITNEMLHITEVAELENEVETLLEAKGFNGAVVSIGDNSVDVVINMTDVDDKERAQIEDIVKRKTEVSLSNIVITPITVEN